MEPIYLDYNATTPIAREAAEAMIPFLYEHFGNPSSNHPYGVAAKRAVENARKQVAGLIGCQTVDVAFTSGGEPKAIIMPSKAQRLPTGGVVIMSSLHLWSIQR